MGAGEAGPVVEIEGSVTLAEYRYFNRWHYFHSAARKARMAIGAGMVIVLVAFALGDESGFGRVLALCVAAAALLGGSISGVLARSTISRVYASNEGLRAVHRMTFSRDGVAGQSEAGSGRNDWSRYWRAADSKEAVYLYTASNMALILPKRCFESEEQMERFREIVRAGMGPESCRV